MTQTSEPLIQNRLVASFVLTFFILIFLAVCYMLYKKRRDLGEAQRRIWTPETVKVFQFILGGSAALALVASIFPHRSPEAGVLLYFILWPLLGLQFMVSCLPWRRFVQKSATGSLVAASIIGFCAFNVVLFMLKLTSYI